MGAAIGVRAIPNDHVGVVEKRFGGNGHVQHGFMAVDGQAGFQPELLRGGLHVRTPLKYSVHKMPLVTISQGKIGYVFARDGTPLTATLASNVNVRDFEDSAEFLRLGGQRGPQRTVLREGTYAINLAHFAVITEERVYSLRLDSEDRTVIQEMAQEIQKRRGFSPVVITDDMVGIVTVHDGPSLMQGDIIAPVVGDDLKAHPELYHNSFQEPDVFLAAGGMRGRQAQVLTEGTFFINRMFATVEMIRKTTVEVGTVGVVVSYTGANGGDTSGESFKHGELVRKGDRGVWNEALLPGKYAFNTYAGTVITVPTTNIILKWTRAETGQHKLDENLREIALITKDAFEPSLPLSVVVHIDYRKAPYIVQRFGDVKRLVEQTLDPMVAAYFKNIGQTRTLIELIQERSDIQRIASDQMREKFAWYNLELEEVLIGTPASSEGDQRIEDILTQLRQRQIAREQVETYERMQQAAVKERELREAEARANRQEEMTASELSIAIAKNQGTADYERSIQQAAQMRALASAEAEKTASLGIAEALAVEEKVRAYGGPQFQVTQQVMSQFATAIGASGIDIVPRVVVGGGGGGKEGGAGLDAVQGLLTLLLADKSSGAFAGGSDIERPTNPEAAKIREALKARLSQQAQPEEIIVPRS